MPLLVHRSHPHFAPSVETVTLSFVPPSTKKVDALKLEIKDRDGTAVFRRTWDGGGGEVDLREFDWGGEDNLSPVVNDPVTNAPLARFVNPLGSPYEATFEATLSDAPLQQPPPELNPGGNNAVLPCRRRRNFLLSDMVDDSAVQSGSTAIKVLYREVHLEAIPWLDAYKSVSRQANGQWPGGASDDVKKMWMIYKLNELGYPAGPIQAPPDPHALLRALFRYTQSYPEVARFPKVYDFDTLAAGAPGTSGWGWKAPWEQRYGTLDQLCQGGGPPGATTLLNALRAGERPRADLFEHRREWIADRRGAKFILDHDIFYQNQENTDPDAHALYDKEFLNRVCWPLRAKVLLLSRNDWAGTRAGVDAPMAVGPVECEWQVFDPAENTRAIPQPVTTEVPARFKSKTRIYLDQFRRSVAQNYGDEGDARDNCPVDLGGVRQGAGDMNGYFRPVEHASTAVARGTRFFAACADLGAAPAGGYGASTVFFTGSYIAGDDYVIQVRLNLEHASGGAHVGPHRALQGLSTCFGPRRSLAVDERLPLIAQSGTLTVWRRHHVLREVYWMDTTNYAATNWSAVVRKFAAAHILLVPPTQPPIHVETLFAQNVRDELLQSLVDGTLNARSGGHPLLTNRGYIEFNKPNVQPTFHRGGLYPIGLPDFDTVAPQNLGRGPARFSAYAEHLGAIRNEWPTYLVLREFFRAFRERFDALDEGPGLVVIRAALLPHPATAAIPQDVERATVKERRDYRYVPRTLSAGGDHGVVLLDECSIEKFDESFLVSHEVAHCLFLTHLFQFPADHDNDPNCIMTYNTQNGGEGVGWAASAEHPTSTFGLRVDLMASQRGIPKLGSISGDFTAIDPKEYHFTGSVEKCQKALKSFKFTPDKRMPSGTTVEIKLSPLAPSPAPGLPVDLPFKVTAARDGGSVKPFADIQVIRPDPRATQPFFCGKCVLKLRGWRVREDAQGTAPPPGVPQQNQAIPVRPRMESLGFKIVDGHYLARVNDTDTLIALSADAVDPLNPQVRLGPLRFLHPHRFTWESSDGNLQSLANVRTRELVRFRQPTQAPPFSDFADPDQFFAQQGGMGNLGSCIDDHSVAIPSLICASPRVAGTLIAEQWYQYSLDNGATWINIEEAAFLLEKTVYQSGNRWVLKFKKSNFDPHNPNHFSFEAHYLVGPVPPSTPKIIANDHAGASIGAPVIVGQAQLFLAGANTGIVNAGAAHEVDERWLLKKGFLAPKPWP